MITPEKDIYERILFCGPSCGFDGAIWLDDARFIITGYGDDIPTCDDGRCVTPHLYLFNVAKNTMTLYYGPSVSAEVFFGE